MSPEKVILYHDKCPDGFGGAFAAWKKFGADASYIPAKRGEPFPEGLEGKEVYLIDFTSYPKEVLLDFEKKAKKFVILDHHVSAKESITAVKEHVYDPERSGAGIAWNYFHAEVPLPLFMQYVQDTDLWKYVLPHQAELRAYMNTLPLEFELWDRLLADFEIPERLSEYVKKGEAYLEYLTHLRKELSEDASLANFEGYEIYTLNAPGFFFSDLGNELALKKGPFSLMWYEKEGTRRFGLRSDGSIDVSVIAKRYGGGGQKSAAGFRTSLDAPLPFTLINPDR